MSDPGPPPDLSWLPIDRLDVDPDYQRSLDTPRGRKLIETIAAEFDWRRFGALMAVPGKADDKGPRWNIVDGQHRTAGARKRGGIPHLPALVFSALSQAEQAAAFVGMNRDRVAMSAQALFHARIVAGDPEACAIKKLCDHHGLGIERSNKAVKQLAAGRTAAVSVLLAIRRGMGEAVCTMAVAAVAERFARQPGALSGALFRGAASFLRDGGGTERLRAALGRFDIRCLDQWNRLGHNSGGAEVADELRRLAGPPPPAEGRTISHRPKLATAPPLKTGPLPSPVPSTDPTRAEEQDQIARFLAEKGARQVMGPEQVAAFLRDSGHRCVVREVNEGGPRQGLRLGYRPELDGKPVTIERLYAAANELRAKAGLQPVSPATVAGQVGTAPKTDKAKAGVFA